MTIATVRLKLRDHCPNWVKVEVPFSPTGLKLRDLLQLFSFCFPYLPLDSASRVWHVTHFDGSSNRVDEKDYRYTFWRVK